MRLNRSFVRLLLSTLFSLISGCFAYGQITAVTNSTSTPIPGTGHNYIQMLNETVNPANGAVSLRVQVPVPRGRGFTVPFAFAYDSNGPHFVVNDGLTGGEWRSDPGPLSQGGWSYSVPLVNYTVASQSYCDFEGQNCYTCDYTTNYLFQDSSGGRHNLDIGVLSSSADNRCSQTFASHPTGSDDFVFATTDNDGFAQNVYDLDGTLYSFSSSSLPSTVEDRNGNKTVISDSGGGAFSITDTLGRLALSSSGFGTSGNTLSVSGLSQPYTVSWGTASSNFTLGYAAVPGAVCNEFPSHHSETQPVITAIALPNGTRYQFTYESIYGLLHQVAYPTGGWVKYDWGINPQSEYQQFTDQFNNVSNCKIDWFAIRHRYVSFDGTNVALQQDFDYSTTWNQYSWTSKQTIVTTRDLIRGTSFTTTYVYASSVIPSNDPFYGNPAGQMPVEQTVTYKDSGGQTLRTVTKSWFDPYLLQSEQETLDNGLVSKKSYDYAQSLSLGSRIGLPKETDDYDYAQGSPGALLRKTITNYASFPSTPMGGTILDRPCQVITYDGAGNRVAEQDFVYDGGTTVCGAPGSASTSSVGNLSAHDETNYSAGSTVSRGNATTVTKQCFPSCANAVTTFTYDETGQALTMTDPCGNATCSDMTGTNHTTTYSYADNFDSPPSANTNAYVTQITSPPTNGITHIQKFKYAYSDGQVIQSTDQNNQVTSYVYAAPLRRLTETDYPDCQSGVCGKTNISYNDTAPSPSATTSRLMNTSNQYVTSTATMDGLGHVVKSLLTIDPDCASGDRTDTRYDGLGRVYTVSNPYCTTSDSTYGLTTYTYDALGRATQVTHPDNTTVLTTYTGRATQLQDEGNGTRRVTRISQVDGLGRLASLCEVTSASQVGSGGTPAACGQDIAATGFLTSYQYDALDNLLQVNQSGISARSFNYDSLSRLTSATNPESGQICYGTVSGGACQANGYDANGNLSTKTDARGITATYGYDALNRITQKTYSDSTPAMYYSYDVHPAWGLTDVTNVVGRLVEARNQYAGTTGSGTDTVNSYDAMGRVIRQWQQTPDLAPGGDFLYYTYDLAGDLASSTNGVGVTFNNAVNGAMRLTTMTSSLVDSNHPGTLFSAAHYNAAGLLLSGSLGTVVSETRTYDPRLRLASIADGSNYSLTIPSSGGYAPNSNILAANDSVNGNWTYSYDDFNRLSGSNQNSGQSVYSYVYDRFGNRWQQNGPNPFLATFTGNNPGNPQNNNRMDGYSYDAAGNFLNDGTHGYTYDAENRVSNVDNGSTASYVYDANGQRVRKTTSSGSVDYLYDLSGHEITELSSSGSWNRGEVYAGGRHLATYNNGTTYLIHSDHLGTERVRTNSSGASCETVASLPFGDWQTTSGSCGDPSPIHFTGKERDSESGLDNFGARYFGSSFGRFMSPDPLGGHQEDPQTLNKYVYVRNNPLNLTDPTGLDFYLVCTPQTDSNGKQVGSSTCQQQRVGGTDEHPQMAWLQGVTGDNGFTATQIGNDANGNLVDKTTGSGFYTGAVDGSGVQFAQQGSNTASAGIWVNGSAETKFTQTSGALAGFSFDFNQTSKQQTANGTFYYPGAPRDAYDAILKAGFSAAMADDFFNPLHGYIGSYHYRSAGDPGTGRNSGHLIIRGVGPWHPWDTVPTRGDLHFGETNPQVNFFQHFSKDVF